MDDKSYIKAVRDMYIFDGECFECGKHKPVNKFRSCEFCDKYRPEPPKQEEQK